MATDTQNEIKRPFPTSVVKPEALDKELRRMRRDPSEFKVTGIGKCQFCGQKLAVRLTHPLSPEAGTWCPVNGWLFFDSVAIRPIGEEYMPKKRKKVA